MLRSGLHEAAVSGNLTKVRRLIADGTDVNVRDNDGETPLHEAVINGHKEVVETLLETKSIKVDVKDSDEETPLHYAAAIGCLDVLKKLIKKQTKINAQDKYGNTPLHYAAEYGHPNVVEELVKSRAKVNIKNYSGRTPLDLADDSSKLKAIEEGRLDRVKLSLNNTKPIEHAADFKEADEARLQITKPKFDESQSSWQVYVPKNSNCLFLAVILAYLVPVKDNDSEFQDRFDRLYKNLQCKQQEQVKEDYDKKLRDVQVLIKGYNPFSDAMDTYGKLNELVQPLRKRVGIDDPNAWGSDGEVKKISKLLECKFSVFPSTGNTYDISVYRRDVQKPQLKLSRYTTTARGSRDGNYYSFNLEKNIGDRYKQQANVERQLYMFIKYFVEEFEAKLHFYHRILEGEVKKAGKFSDTFSGKIGQGVGGVVGGAAGFFAGMIVQGAKAGATLGESAGKKIGGIVGNKQYVKKVVSLSDIIAHSQEDKVSFRKELVETGFDIFQSFEMQFMRVKTSKGPKDAMHELAKDAVNRAVSYMKSNKDTSISESVILGESKKEAVYSQNPRFEIQYEYQLSEKVWYTASLYEKAGLVVIESGTSSIYYKKTDLTSRTGKYGYRRLLATEDWKKLEKKYDSDNIAESKSGQFTDYQYILNSGGSEEKSQNILDHLNDKDESLGEERIKEVLKEVKNDILEEIDVLKKQSHEDHEMLVSIENSIENLNIDKYLEEFRQYLQGMADSIKKGREENREGFKQVIRRVDEANEENREGFKQVIQKLDELDSRQDSKQVKKSIWFEVRKSVASFIGRQKRLDQIATDIQQGIVFISGLGGVGKSELAIKYACDHREDYNDNVVWVNAGTNEVAKNSFRRLLKELGLKTADQDGDEKSIGSMAKEVYDHFAGKISLFIFDDAREYAVIEAFLPSSTSNFHVLITSYNRKLFNEQEHGKVKKLDLGPLSKDKAVELVKNTLSINNTRQDKEIKELVKILGRLPLALQHAISYIKESGYIEAIGRYVETYKKSEQEVESFLKREGLSSYNKTIFATLKTTIDKVKQERNGKLAEEILSIIAYFASDNISRETFLELARGKVEENDVDIKNHRADGMLMRAINLLNQYSIIDLDKDMLNIHRLVQQVRKLELKEQKNEEGKTLEEEILEKALMLLKKHIETVPGNAESCIPHIISIWNYASKYDKLIESFIVNVDNKATTHTPHFHLIAEGSSYEVVDTVIKKIEQNHPDSLNKVIDAQSSKDSGTPLHKAILRGNERTIKLLIEKGADVNAKKNRGWTPLHLAAKNGLLGVVNALLGKNAEVKVETEHKFTPLHLAAQNGHLEVVNALLGKNAEVKVETKHKFTPLHLAAQSGYLEIVEVLLEKKAEIEAETQYKFTPLHLAAKNGHVNVVNALLEKGASVNALDTGNFTPLHLAAQKGHVKVVNNLLEDSKIEVNAQTTRGNTPLHLAAKNGHKGIIEVLLNKGADVHIKNKDGKTSLDLAREAGHIKVVDMLIDTKMTNVSLYQHQVSFLGK